MIGQTISHYKITEKLGEGGMGVVYKAEDTKLGRTVAIKFLAAHLLADPEHKARFLREARAAAALDHPNIATIHEIDEANGHVFLSMAYVEGASLDRKIKERPLKLDDALDMAIQTAQGLQAAHEKGIVHRDIKSANLLLTKRGEVKITDFGLARFEDRTRLTKSGITLGTPAYMSPEQAAGRALDHRSDIWSLGVVLYEMVAGRLPFGGEVEQAVLYSILNENPEPVTALRSGVPLELDHLLAKALAKDPANRYQHADELLVDLRQIRKQLAGSPSATPVPAGKRDRPLPRAYRMAAAAVLIVTAAVVAWLWNRTPSDSASDPADPRVLTRLTSDPGLTFQPAISLDGRLLAYASDRAGQGNLDIWVQQVGGGQPVRLTTHEADETEPAFSPDGARIVFRSGRDGGGVYSVPTLGGEEPRLVASQGRRPRFSPDGNWIAYWVGSESNVPGSIYLVGAAGGESKELASGRSPIWSPDSRHVLFTGADQQDWYVVSLDGGDPQPTGALERQRQREFVPTVQRSFIADAWHPEGDAVVFSARLVDSTNLWRIPLSPESRQVTGWPSRLTHGTGTEAQASLAADGSLVFSTLVENFDIWALPADSDRGFVTGEIAPLTRNAAADHTPAISAEGTRMVFLSDRSGNWDVWTKDLMTGGESNVSATPVDESWPIVSADGSGVAYRALREGAAQADLYVVLGRGGVPRKVCDDCVGVLADWSPDGQGFIFYGAPPPGTQLINQASLFRVNSGETVTLMAEEEFVADLQFSPDGRWLAFHTLNPARERRQVFIAPFRTTNLPIERVEWIPITDGLGSDGHAGWSPNGNLLYFLSDRDGYRCIRAQRLDPAAKQPIGAPMEIYHLHFAGRSLVNMNLGNIGLSVARDKIAITIRETSGNIWLRTAARRD